MVVSTTMISKLRHSAPSAHQRRFEGGGTPPLEPAGALRPVTAEAGKAALDWFLVMVLTDISSPD
jgi:hypothetical protein